MNHLIEKKERYEQKKPEKIPLQQHLKNLGLNRPADFVSWGFSFGKITKESSLHKVEATTWANENTSNVHITGEDGELASLLKVFPELNISGSYRDEYSAGSIQGYEKIQEQSREEVDAEEAEWGSDDYSEATKTLLNKTYRGPFGLKEARQLIAQGADLNASMNGTCFGGMLADPGWELYKAIPEFLEKGMEMRTIRYLHADLARILAQKYVEFELNGLFHLETDVAAVLVDEVSKRSTPKDGKEWKQELGGNWFWRNLFQEGPFLSLNLQEVSEDLARILIQFPGKLIFSELREIPKSLAKILAQHVGTLSLGISHELDEELASILSIHQGVLDLGDFGAWSEGVVELSEKAALEIGKHKGPLSFTGLRTISSKAAAGLAKNIYGLHFQDLGWWDSTGAELNDLNDNQGNSYRFNLPDETLSELMRCPGEIYIGIDHLNEKRAEIIAANTGYCWMDHYRRSLQPEIARILVKKKGGLGLNAITELSDEVCEILSDFKGTLNLERLEKTGPKGLQFLKVIWDAPEPTRLGCPLVDEFAKRNAPETILEKQEKKPTMSFYYAEGETPLGPFSAAHILSLKSLGKISAQTWVIPSGEMEWKPFAELEPLLRSLLPPMPKPQPPLAQTRSDSFSAPPAEPQKSLETKPAEAPQEAKTGLTFTDTFLALAKSQDNPGRRFSRLASLLKDMYDLNESDAKRIVAGAIQEGYQGSLALSSLTEISLEFAEILATHPTREEMGEILYLNGLEELPPALAEVLAKHRGYVSLSGVKTLSQQSAAALKRHKGRIDLEGLSEMTEPVARELADHQYHLTLDGIKSISLEVLAHLGRHAQPIDLHGLKKPAENILKELKNYPQILLGDFEDEQDENNFDADEDEEPFSASGADDEEDNDEAEEDDDELLDSDSRSKNNYPNAPENKEADSDISENDSQEVKAFKVMDLLWGDDDEGVVQGLNLLSGLDRVTVKRIFRFFPKTLNLGRLRKLPQVTGLELYSGDLLLDGIKSLTAEKASTLAQKPGFLSLNGLAELPVDLARSFAGHRGTLSLKGLNSVSLETANEIAKHTGNVCFGLQNPPEEIQKVLRRMAGYVGPKLRPPFQDFDFLAKLLDVPQSALARLAGVSQWGERTPLYRVFFIPKRNGSSRIIHSPCDSLRWIQGLIKACILDPAPVHSECVSAFRLGKSILHHAMQHAGKAVVIKMDLQDFFPSVTFPKVEQVFRKLGFAGAVARQLTLLTTTNLREGREMPEQIPAETQGLSRPETWRALPQGAPTSPQLANMAGARLDLRLIGLCKSFGFHYSRYADDLTFSSPDSKAKASTLIRAVQQIVETSGFWVNPEKTRIMRATSTQKVTGLIVGSGQPRVPRKVMRRVRAMVHQSKTKNTFQEHSRLRGYLSFIKMINESQFAKFGTQMPTKTIVFNHPPVEGISSVSLAGTFNGWNPEPLSKKQDSSWCISKSLPAGTYAYKFVINGKWCKDPANSKIGQDGHGGENSILEIS